MSMNVSFDGGKTWVSENDMGAVDREIQKMNGRKKKKVPLKTPTNKVLKIQKQGGR